MIAYRIFFIIMGLFAILTLSLTGSVLAQPHHGRGFWADLTEEQKKAIQAKIIELRDQGATREEIHETITEMLGEFGIEPHENWGGPHGPFSPHLGPLWEDLTKEQREAIRNRITEMREQGATHEEIHAAVIEMLEEFGIELPEDWGGRGHGGPDSGRGFWATLTEEQREAIHNTITELRDQGATREQIHTAVTEMLEEYGVKLPEDWGEGFRDGCGHGGPGFGRGFWTELTDKQKEELRNKIREMRAQGARREEIHAAVLEILESYGIEFPKDSDPQHFKTSSAEKHIIAHTYPNPFNPETHINYTLNIPGDVRIQIYNVTGQVVRTFFIGYQQVGSYSVLWDGLDTNGATVASGFYFCRIEAGPYSVMNRMMFLK